MRNGPALRLRRCAPPPRPGRRGFTLLELLVAVSILALVSVIAWRGLATLTTTRERLDPLAEDVHALLASLGQMERDLAQSPGNGALYALPTQPVRVLTLLGHPALQIVRLAPSPDGSRANALQTVFYVVADGALVRRSSPAQRVVGGSLEPLDSVVLLPGVDDLQIRVWRRQVGWIAPASDADSAYTTGIEVSVVRHDGTTVRRVFAVG